jgi:hypothetical protein
MLTHTMPAVRKFLDLSTAHLPQEVMNYPLSDCEGVIAYPYEYGAWMYVPVDVMEQLAEVPETPPEVQAVWRYARVQGCDYVRFDSDAPRDFNLPIWDW